jgi:N-acetylmuramoyl-L-alanine amidase
VNRILKLIILIIFTVPITLGAAQPFFLQPVGTLFIDAGHGGKDPGATATHVIGEEELNLMEKDINLALAKKTGEMIRELLPELEIVYTRDDDSYLSLWNRTHIANSHITPEGYSKMFISIHVNASDISEVEGFEIWKLDERIEKDLVSSFVSERSLLKRTEQVNDELNRELDSATALLADQVRSALAAELPESRDRGIKEGFFYVIEQALMPSILIETGFLTTKSEAERLITTESQDRISSALAAGIVSYIQKITER